MSIATQVLANTLVTGSLYAVAAAGLSLSYSVTKTLSFAYGQSMMSGVYVFWWASTVLEAPLLQALLLGILWGGMLGWLTFRFFVSPFLKFHPVLPFLTTLSLSTMIESVISMLFGVDVKSLSSPFNNSSIEIFGAYITPLQILTIVCSILLFILLFVLLNHSRYGREILAVSENREAAQGLGISADKIGSFVAITSGVVASIAGIAVGYDSNLTPTLGNFFTIKVFAAMVVGGLGSVSGTIVGSFLLSLIENLSVIIQIGDVSLPTGYKDSFSFFLIVLMLMCRPSGLFGKKGRKL